MLFHTCTATCIPERLPPSASPSSATAPSIAATTPAAVGTEGLPEPPRPAEMHVMKRVLEKTTSQSRTCGTHGARDQQCAWRTVWVWVWVCTVWACTMCGVWGAR